MNTQIMAVWRQKAIWCLPELRNEFQASSTSIFDVFIEMLPAVVEAHKKNDIDRLRNIYDFAEWCFRQKEKDLWNAVGVGFYEHLGDYEKTRRSMTSWVKFDIYKEIRGLLETRMGIQEILTLDRSYGM